MTPQVLSIDCQSISLNDWPMSAPEGKVQITIEKDLQESKLDLQ